MILSWFNNTTATTAGISTTNNTLVKKNTWNMKVRMLPMSTWNNTKITKFLFDDTKK